MKDLNPLEKAAWQSFKYVCCNFLWNHKAENYCDIVANLVKSFQTMGYNVFKIITETMSLSIFISIFKLSLKIHVLDSHLDFFPENLGTVTNEHGSIFISRFLQWERDTETNGVCWVESVCWLIITGQRRDISQMKIFWKYSRKSSSTTF